jgi:3-oxoacyl-[acyl-carrier protein] reductase
MEQDVPASSSMGKSVDLSARRAGIIVGATGSLGRQIAELMHHDGFDLTLTYLKTKPSKIQEFVRQAPRTRHCRMDVTDSAAVRQTIEGAEQAHGPLFALVYCAGIVRDMPLLLTPDDVWNSMLDVNLTGAFYCIRAISRSMMVAGCGRIILIGSVSARCARPGQASYSSSKAGLEALSRVAALELGRYGVTCNVIAPGAVESELYRKVDNSVVNKTILSTPLRRLGTPKEISSAVRYLLTEEAGFITGQALLVDGGISAV